MSATPIHPGLFALEGPDAGRLRAARCAACRRWHFPAASICPYCGAAECEAGLLSREGTLQLCTTVVNRPPGYDGPLPFGFGVVELPEGIQVLARIAHPERLQPGDRVESALATLSSDADGREVVTYAFGPPAAR